MTTSRVSSRSASLKLQPRTIAMPAASKKDFGPVRDEGAVVGRRLEPVDVEVARALAEQVQVQVADGAYRLDAGERAEAIEEAPRVDARLVGREPGRRRQEGHQGGRLAAEARVDRLHPLRAAEEQAGADEQHRRDHQLRDDQRVAPPELTGLTAASVLALEGAGDGRPGAPQRRHQTEQAAGHDRDASRKIAHLPEAVRSAVRERRELTAKVTAYGAEIDEIAGSHRKPRSAISLAKWPIRTLADAAGTARIGLTIMVSPGRFWPWTPPSKLLIPRQYAPQPVFGDSLGLKPQPSRTSVVLGSSGSLLAWTPSSLPALRRPASWRSSPRHDAGSHERRCWPVPSTPPVVRPLPPLPRDLSARTSKPAFRWSHTGDLQRCLVPWPTSGSNSLLGSFDPFSDMHKPEPDDRRQTVRCLSILASVSAG